MRTTVGSLNSLNDGVSTLLAWWRQTVASSSWAQLLGRDAPDANNANRRLEEAVEDAAAALAVAEAALAHPEGSAPRPRIVVRLSVGLAELLGQDGEVGTTGYCSPRQQTHREPSFLE
jgi:hypothetical protein